MLRGFVRSSKPYPASRQLAILRAAGVPDKATYVDDLSGAVRSLRKGDAIAVAGLRALGDSKHKITLALDKLHDAGWHAVDAATGRRSDRRDGHKLMAEAAADLSNERRGGDIGKLARMGAEASAKVRGSGRLPLDICEKFWFDRTLENDEVMDRINNYPGYSKPWGQSSLYRKLGPREVVAGRPPKDPERRQAKAARATQRRRFRLGAVYFIRSVADTGPVKIGYSTEPHGRLATLQTSHHGELKIIAAIEGTREDEQALHERFATFRMRGEWFRVAGKFKQYLRALPPFGRRSPTLASKSG